MYCYIEGDNCRGVGQHSRGSRANLGQFYDGINNLMISCSALAYCISDCSAQNDHASHAKIVGSGHAQEALDHHLAAYRYQLR